VFWRARLLFDIDSAKRQSLNNLGQSNRKARQPPTLSIHFTQFQTALSMENSGDHGNGTLPVPTLR